jgi:hypothetical protein
VRVVSHRPAGLGTVQCVWVGANFESAGSRRSRLAGERVVSVSLCVTDRPGSPASRLLQGRVPCARPASRASAMCEASVKGERHVRGQRQGRAPCARPASKACAMCEASVKGERHVRGQRQGRAPCARPASRPCAMCEASVKAVRHVRGQRQGRAPCARPASRASAMCEASVVREASIGTSHSHTGGWPTALLGAAICTLGLTGVAAGVAYCCFRCPS